MQSMGNQPCESECESNAFVSSVPTLHPSQWPIMNICLIICENTVNLVSQGCALLHLSCWLATTLNPYFSDLRFPASSKK